MSAEKPKVRGTIDIHQEVDFGASLDMWTLEEIDAYLAGEDDSGYDVLLTECDVIGERDRYMDFPREAAAEYAEWRRANGLFGRMA